MHRQTLKHIWLRCVIYLLQNLLFLRTCFPCFGVRPRHQKIFSVTPNITIKTRVIMHAPNHFYISISILSFETFIIITYGVFHFLRLRYRTLSNPKPSKRKCINLPLISYIIIISSLLKQFFKLFSLIIPSYYHDSVFVTISCECYTILVIELHLIIKLGVHLFVILRSRIVESHSSKRSIWFKIVCYIIYTPDTIHTSKC